MEERMKVHVSIQWSPSYRKWSWDITEVGNPNPFDTLDGGFTRTLRGAKSRVAGALADLKEQKIRDEENRKKTISFTATI